MREVGEWLDERARRAAPAGHQGAARAAATSRPAREQLLPLVEAYSRLKREREVIDYGDQMALAARIAARHPEVGEIERGRFAVVLLDEYQDTSHAQLVLLRALFGGGHPVTAVGDPCQSIYGWRGASAGNLRRFPADFPTGRRRPGAGARSCRQLPQRRAGAATSPPGCRSRCAAEAGEVPVLRARRPTAPGAAG